MNAVISNAMIFSLISIVATPSLFGQSETTNPKMARCELKWESVPQDTLDVSRTQPAIQLDWKEDSACQLVFFAVLEGLYRDGVKDDVVENVIGAPSSKTDEKSLESRMRLSFVSGCPLCRPTFEAFLAYQNRPRASDGLAIQFGDGLDEKLRRDLLSDETMTRLKALRSPVQGWVLAKLESSGLSDAEVVEMKGRLRDRAKEGTSMLNDMIQEDSEHYRDWTMYWGCAACNGSRDAANLWKREK